MARKFTVPIDLQQLELLRPRLEQRTGDPTSGVEGQLYWNSTTDKVRVCITTGSPGTWGDLLTGPITSGDIQDGTITDADVAAANKDGAAATPSLRTLGTGAQQATAGNDARLTNSRAPTAHASTHQPGGSDPMTVDAAAATGSLRTLGTGAAQAAAGNDTRFTDARAPTAHAASHQPGGSDAMAVDAVVATGSLRTLGAGAQQAMPGNRTLDAITAPAADVAFNAKKATGLADPTAAQDAATKAYVDTTAQGLDAKASVRAASVGNLTLSAPQTVDGVALIAGDRVLVKDQTTPAQNGIYTVAAGAWVRATDTDTWNELVSAFTFVESGTVNADSGWTATVDPGGTLNTTAVTWAQFSGAGSITAGAGLTKTGNTLSVNVDNASIEINANTLRVKAAGITNAMLAGAIDLASKVTGLLAIANGGTGASTAASARANLGTNGVYSNNATHGAATPITITAATHALGAGRNKIVQVIEEATGDVVETDTNIAANGDVTVGFAVAPAANAYRVLIAAW